MTLKFCAKTKTLCQVFWENVHSANCRTVFLFWEKNIVNWENIFLICTNLFFHHLSLSKLLFFFFQLNIYPTFGFTKMIWSQTNGAATVPMRIKYASFFKDCFCPHWSPFAKNQSFLCNNPQYIKHKISFLPLNALERAELEVVNLV